MCKNPQVDTDRPAVGVNRHDVELALQASHWLGASVLRPAAGDQNRERASRP